MRVIREYLIPANMTGTFSFSLAMPQTPDCYPDVLDVQVVDGKLYLWAIVDPEGEREEMQFAAVMTGDQLPDNYRFWVGTFRGSSGMIFHLFEIFDLTIHEKVVQ